MSVQQLNPGSAGRGQKWDILKFILIFLVVLGHAADYFTADSEIMRGIYVSIYIFHMPIFFFVSGLFSKKAVDKKRKDKAIGFVMMYVFMKVVVFITQLLSGVRPKFDLFSEGGFPWYLLAMAFCITVTMLLKDFSWKYVLTFSIIIACFAGYNDNIGNFLCLSRFIVFYPFYYIGYIADREKLEKFCKGKPQKIVSAILIAAMIVFIAYKGDDIYWVRLLLTGRNPYSSLNGNWHFGFWFRLVYYFVAFVIGTAVVILTPERTPKGFIAKLGQRTLGVYVFHYSLLYLVFNVLDCKQYFEEWVIVPLSLIITLLLSARFITSFLQKIMNVPPRTTK